MDKVKNLKLKKENINNFFAKHTSIIVVTAMFLLSGSITGVIADNDTCEIKVNSLKDLLKYKHIQEYTTMDEELDKGNLMYNEETSLVEQDDNIRKKSKKLNFINKLMNKDDYLATYELLKEDSRNTEIDLLMKTIKCSVAEELDVNMKDLEISYASKDYEPPYIIRNKNTDEKFEVREGALFNAIDRVYELQACKISHNSAKRIGDSYEDSMLIAENLLKQATSLHNNELVDKFDLSFVKKKLK